MLHFFWAIEGLKGLSGSVLKHVYMELVTDYLVLKYWTCPRWGNCKAGEYKVGAAFYQLASLKHLPLGISVEQNFIYAAFFVYQVWLAAHMDNKFIKPIFKMYLFWVSKMKFLCDVENPKMSLGCIIQMRISDTDGSLFVCWKSLWNPQFIVTRKPPDTWMYQTALFWYRKTDKQMHRRRYMTSSIWRKGKIKRMILALSSHE